MDCHMKALLLNCALALSLSCLSPLADNHDSDETPIVSHQFGQTFLLSPLSVSDQQIYYAGASLGRDMGFMRFSNTKNDLFDMEESGFVSRLFWGLGRTLENRYYLAGELGFQMNSAQHKDDFIAAQYTQWAFNTSTPLGYSASLLAGLRPTNDDLFYLRAGAALNTFQSSASSHGEKWSGPSFNQHVKGLLLGIGHEASLNDQLRLRIEYTSRYFTQALHQTNDWQAGGTAAVFGKRPISEQFSIGFAYKFSPENIDVPHNINLLHFSGAYTGFTMIRDQLHLGLLTKVNSDPYSHVFENADGFGINAFGGYGLLLNTHAYMGLEATVGYHSTTLEQQAYGNSIQGFQSRESYDLSLLPGLRSTDSSLFFLRFGLSAADFSRPETNTVTESGPRGDEGPVISSRLQTGYRYGAGFELAAAPHMSIRCEYNYTQYHTISTASGNTTYHWTPTREQALLGLKYTF